MFSSDEFSFKEICSWNQFLEALNGLDKEQKWIFRGQSKDWLLKTTLERALEDYGICLNRAEDIEADMIRDFRRRYRGNDRDLVLGDTLYCLSVMQHYGAPTRLLDWDYSPYIAAFFALESKVKKGSSNCDLPVVWCINTNWCISEIKKIFCDCFIKFRNQDEYRNDFTFRLFYVDSNVSFAFPENPTLLNDRLII